MLIQVDGGYDEGYRAVKGFWGKEPGSLVEKFLLSRDASGLAVLDVGAGEGKNAAAFASSGAYVDALECSETAIENGRDLFRNSKINWIHTDAILHHYPTRHYDVVVCYGLIHCLGTEVAAAELIGVLQDSLKEGGTFMLVAFNDGSHDLSAHPGFNPLLLSHDWFLRQFDGWKMESASSSILFETHPHNGIPHHHTLTRLSAVKP